MTTSVYLMRGKRNDNSEWMVWEAPAPDTTGIYAPVALLPGSALVIQQTSGPTPLPDPTGAPDGQVPTTASGAYVLATPAGGPSRVPLLTATVSTVLGADTVAGYGYVDPTGLASLTLEAIGQVVSGVTGTLDLYDLTAAAVVATLTWTETVATRKTASVTVPGTARLYELRVRKSGGAGADYALFSASTLTGS